VVAQLALSVALLSAAGVLVRHWSGLAHLDLGFQRDHVLLVKLNASGSGYDREQLSRAYRRLLERLAAIPGVRSATMCGYFPMSGVGAMRPATVEAYQARPGERRFLSQNWVTPQYFATFGIPLLMGRDFGPQDAGGPRVAVVNQTLARHFFPAANPIGKHLTFDGDSQPFEIVGVVGDAKSGDLREPALRFVYLNSFQAGMNSPNFALRTSVDPEQVAASVRREVLESAKTVFVENARTLAGQIDAAIVPERLSAVLSGLFAALGALLAALGIYGLLAYAVEQRIHEIGIRMAIGATPGNITQLVLREGLGLGAVGLAIGTLLAHWGKHFLSALIPDVQAQSIAPLLFGGAVMVVLTVLAAYVPAHRATRIDCVAALRWE
jgi:predicted permease